MNNKLSIQDLALVFAEQSGMDVKASTAFVKTVFEIIEEYIEGAPTMKAAVIPVVLEYSTTNALK